MSEQRDGNGDEGPQRQARERRRHEERAFGYAVTVPSDFVVLMNTVDPLARLLRGLHDKLPDEETALTGSWPVGFADPQVVGDIGGGHSEPLRLLEFDVLERPDPLSAGDLAVLQQSVVGALPQEIDALRLARASSSSAPASSSWVRSTRSGSSTSGTARTRPPTSPTAASWSGPRRPRPSITCTTTVRPPRGAPGGRSSSRSSRRSSSSSAARLRPPAPDFRRGLFRAVQNPVCSVICRR